MYFGVKIKLCWSILGHEMKTFERDEVKVTFDFFALSPIKDKKVLLENV